MRLSAPHSARTGGALCRNPLRGAINAVPMASRRPARRRAVDARAMAPAGGDKPEWYLDLEDRAQEDPELAALLAAADDDPASLERRMRSEMDALHARIVGSSGSGEDAPPEVSFRATDPFDTWVWLEMYSPPSASELEMAQEVVNSWFMLGRLGAYNSSNLQVMYSGEAVGPDLEYDAGEAAGALASSMHDMGALEANGPWLRFWVDMGTTDELAFDILINALVSFSKEHVGVRQIVVGGENEDWPVPESAGGPEAAIDPMGFM